MAAAAHRAACRPALRRHSRPRQLPLDSALACGCRARSLHRSQVKAKRYGETTQGEVSRCRGSGHRIGAVHEPGRLPPDGNQLAASQHRRLRLTAWQEHSKALSIPLCRHAIRRPRPQLQTWVPTFGISHAHPPPASHLPQVNRASFVRTDYAAELEDGVNRQIEWVLLPPRGRVSPTGSGPMLPSIRCLRRPRVCSLRSPSLS